METVKPRGQATGQKARRRTADVLDAKPVNSGLGSLEVHGEASRERMSDVVLGRLNGGRRNDHCKSCRGDGG